MNNRSTSPEASPNLRPVSRRPRASNAVSVRSNRRAPLQLVQRRADESQDLRRSLDQIKQSLDAQSRMRTLFGSVFTKRPAGELVSKIRDGYYRNPHIVHTVAVMICAVLESEP